MQVQLIRATADCIYVFSLLVFDKIVLLTLFFYVKCLLFMLFILLFIYTYIYIYIYIYIYLYIFIYIYARPKKEFGNSYQMFNEITSIKTFW